MKGIAIAEAADQEAELVTFGETLLPGYPFWLELTGGAVFNSQKQKELHTLSLQQAVNIEFGHLEPICQLAKQRKIAVIVGTAARASDRGGHSVYCSLVYIDRQGEILNVHRKLMPTYEERLTWSPGDGHGLRTFPIGPFNMGALIVGKTGCRYHEPLSMPKAKNCTWLFGQVASITPTI